MTEKPTPTPTPTPKRRGERGPGLNNKTVTDPTMQLPDWRYTLAYAGWLAWASNKPQAIVLHRRYDRWQYDITCALDHPGAVWTVLPPVAMPRIPLDV